MRGVLLYRRGFPASSQNQICCPIDFCDYIIILLLICFYHQKANIVTITTNDDTILSMVATATTVAAANGERVRPDSSGADSDSTKENDNSVISSSV